jgi:hypothetical protein
LSDKKKQNEPSSEAISTIAVASSDTNSFSHLTNGYTKNNNIKIKLAILGAPGSGKTQLSAGLLYFSKMFLFKSDSVPEVAKWDVYKGVDFTAPNYELKKYKAQEKLENLYPGNLEITICEAPLIISAIYSSFYRGDDDEVAIKMFEKAQQTKSNYTHFLISRKLVKFEKFGRNETEEEADRLHQKTLEILERLEINYTVINRFDDHIPIQILAMIGAVSRK